MEIKIACATDDGIHFSEEHFGSAKLYLIYSFDLNSGTFSLLEKRENTSPEERMHGDAQKAQGVAEILQGVQVLINRAFGPNITRMRKKFIPVISKQKDIQQALEQLSAHTEELKANLEKEPKDIVRLK